MNKVLSNKWAIAVLVVPGLVIFLFSVLFPILMSGYYGMTDWNGIGDYEFIGLANYQELLGVPVFWRSLWNAVLLAGLTILIQHPIAIFLAILLTQCGRWEKALRTILFIPAVISVVVTAKMWAAIFAADGLVNKALTAIGLEAWRQDWLGNPDIAIWSIIVVVMWQGFGYALLLYYAGLQGIPKDLYEAAELDGASKPQLYGRVIIPLLAPMMRIAIVIAVITCLKQMETVFLMTNGGPGDSTQFLGNYLYVKAFTSGLYGYGNAISVLFVIFALVITVILNRLLRRDVGEY